MMIQVLLIAVALVAISGLYSIVPRLSRPDLFFAVTVAAGFRSTPEAQAIVKRFQTTVWTMTLLAIAMEAVFRVPVAAVAALLIQAAAFAWALVEAHARALPFAVKPASVVEVDLNATAERVPGGLTAVLLPIGALIGIGVWAGMNMDRLPPRFAVHWGFHGPDRWVDTTPATVFSFLGIFTAVCILLGAIAWAMLHWSRRVSTSGPAARNERRFRRRMVLFLIVTEYAMAVLPCLMLFQSSNAALTIWLIVWMVVIVAFVVILFRAGQGGSRGQSPTGPPPIGDRTPDKCWKWGMFYVN